jgi:hypothetical protein
MILNRKIIKFTLNENVFKASAAQIQEKYNTSRETNKKYISIH